MSAQGLASCGGSPWLVVWLRLPRNVARLLRLTALAGELTRTRCIVYRISCFDIDILTWRVRILACKMALCRCARQIRLDVPSSPKEDGRCSRVLPFSFQHLVCYKITLGMRMRTSRHLLHCAEAETSSAEECGLEEHQALTQGSTLRQGHVHDGLAWLLALIAWSCRYESRHRFAGFWSG